MKRDSLPPPSSTPPSVEDVLSLQRDVIEKLIRSPALAEGDLEVAIGLITESAARLLGVRRASVWRFDAERTRIDCLDLYDGELMTHQSAMSLSRDDAPAYFDATQQARCIVVGDARADLRTRDFAESYLIPNDITALLDAPVLVRGQLVGVVCHEHVGSPRAWQAREELLAGTLADFVGMALSAAEHATQARDLGRLRDGLEVLVQERTRELSESRENVRALFAGSPVALILTRRSDQSVLLANRRAAELFDVPMEAARGRRVTDFWVDLSARDHLLELVHSHGRVEGYDTELRTAAGRTFWGSVSVQVITFEGESALLVSVQDVTERKVAEEQLRRSREFLRTLLDAAPIPLVVTGIEDDVIRFSNERAADLFEIDLQSFLGRRAPDFYIDASERRALLDELRRSGRAEQHTARLETAQGRPFWAQLSARTLTLDGQNVMMVGLLDVTEQKQLEARLRELATIDGLTGVYNRRHFFELADALVELAERHDRPLSVAMLDADHFKAINDEHGHAVGDEALRIIAQVCRAELRTTDVLARYGGEEFAFLLPETRMEAAHLAVERIVAMLATSPVVGPAGSLHVTVSVGIASRQRGESLDDVLRRADEALYRAKQAGRNRVEVAP
ncbi:MAG: diguanylate cyclase [Polyangiaceae bacterium]|nr:diguanylate cyclase [Polyangiaceae bacterium]